MSITFNDPLFSSQWYLVNTGQRGGTSRLDINVKSAWDKYTGKGVIVAVNDDGMDLAHPDLVGNLLTNLAYDSGRDTVGQGFVGAANSHGTVVGSIVGMVANDGIGGVGVAYEAKIVPGLAFGAAGTNTANLFLANLAAGAGVSVNSWGLDPAFAENFGASGSLSDQAWGAALLRAASEARGGKGMVIEVSGGNERGNNADAAMSNFTGNKLTIAVGAITETGAPTPYSTPGASLLVTAPGGVSSGDQSLNEGFGISSADVQGTAGYNTTEGAAGDYAYQNQGTSYSGPMVGGAAALMLQANPTLGFRDISTILALTARKVDATNASWFQTHASDWNLGGMHFSRDFGYGLMDVSAAVQLAESWTLPAGTVANWQNAEGVSATASAAIPDISPAGLTVTASVASNVRIERMEFDLNLTAANPSQLSAIITSPSGTTVTLFDQPLTRNLVSGVPDMSTPEPSWPSTFTIGSTAFLGEPSSGTWTLKLTDKVAGEVATYNSLTVRAWGSIITADSQYVLTDEFSVANTTLTDSSGTDTLNAAAVSGAVRLDLIAGDQSTVGAGQFTIAPGSVIENAIGGLGNDTLIGNAANNVLRGNAGNDTIDGSTGIDTAVFGGGRTNYTLTKTGTGFTVLAMSGTDGTDTITGVERLQFSDAKLALDLDGNAGKTAKLLGVVFSPASVSNKQFVGIGLSLLDGGMAYPDLMGAALRAAGATSNSAVVNLLWNNLFGSAPTSEQAKPFVDLLDNGALGAGALGVAAAELQLNQSNINLVGLQQTGIEYA
ncbi:MAG: S8 family serine peptidase [Candidatus Accumulibacter sp.]|uniref:S8 family serine peptidase n=1 Tax=Accumulibacter sp. TaxID=2053492 RepID=UPI002584C3EE|nr:S8 family serine peptidase [Accumulibacter sp.]MCM8623102.1 S8 family serine peptidase [Accumulibacter sp.]